jgi:hypothetical protein
LRISATSASCRNRGLDASPLVDAMEVLTVAGIVAVGR